MPTPRDVNHLSFQLGHRMRQICAVCGLSFALFLPMPAVTAQEEPPLILHNAETPRPGALNVLEACWSPQALRSLPGERVARSLPLPDHNPPAYTTPRAAPLPIFLGDATARSVRSVVPNPGEKVVALTFDLCERANEIAGYDGELIDLLRAEGVHATFFAGGKWMRSHPERAMQLIADPLFEVGNHTWTHGNLRILRDAELEEQIRWTQAQYEWLRDRLLHLPCARTVAPSEGKRIPSLPTAFRFPYGTCDIVSLRAVAQEGLVPIQWSIVTGDPARNQTAIRIIGEVLSAIRPGAIVIAHANGRGWHTREAIQAMIPLLRNEGYRFVTIGELLKIGRPVAVDSCYELHPGDNTRYDRLFGRGTE